MSDEQRPNTIRTRIWEEEPEPDNPFATRAAYCHGYDVYGEMLGKARWVEMLYLLFRGEAPSAAQADMLEALAVALANPGPRHPAIHAAMCGAVGGSPAASCLISALAVGAGQLAGSREIYLAMENWNACGMDLELWKNKLAAPAEDIASIWPRIAHPPGFDPYGVSTATSVRQMLSLLAKLSPGMQLGWLETNRESLERMAGHPVATTGVAAAALADLGFSAQQGEMLHLLLMLPGAAAHSLEQATVGHKRFPFFSLELESAESEGTL